MAFGFGVGIQRLGSFSVATRDELFAITPGAGVRPAGFVWNDSTPAYNGVYAWVSPAWAKQRSFSESVARLTITGGTANNIIATYPGGIDPALVTIAVFTPGAANTAPVAINGFNVLDTLGATLSAGALVAGRLTPLVFDGAAFRLLADKAGVISDISGLQVALDSKADAAATTAALGTKADAAATAAALDSKASISYADGLITGLKDGVSTAYDTLAKIATSITALLAAVADRVAYSDQTKTAAEQAQARKNIGMEFGFPLFHAQDQKPSGTLAGSAVAGFQDRTINTVVTNEIAGASLLGNVITLPVGTYRVRASAPVFNSGAAMPFIAKASDNSVLIVGKVVSSPSGNQVGFRSEVEGRLVVAGEPMGIKLRQYISVAGANSGLGPTLSISGFNEIYSEIFIEQLKQ